MQPPLVLLYTFYVGAVPYQVGYRAGLRDCSPYRWGMGRLDNMSSTRHCWGTQNDPTQYQMHDPPGGQIVSAAVFLLAYCFMHAGCSPLCF